MNWKMIFTGAAAALALASQAHALDFTFSSDLTLGDPTIQSGSVTGEIFGLQNNVDGQAATDVVITSYAPGVLGLPGTPFSLFDYANFLAANVDPNIYVDQNDWDVENGQVVFAVFQIFGGYFDLNVANRFNSMVSPDAQTRVQNLGGFDAVTFSGPIPEPATWTMMLLGFGGLGAGLRARRRPATPRPA
ncbi:PEPxxWA-CTERM sorting domain-containing protein [Phenylobacterium sp.]|uniref:PEPxxWA-CTERM sorting domain-containing protein n=1 Tax=Phenylobacterium sp. TaxID=1871053 RepID=UPI001216974B|nr:PEPxxWA-CTERM sorting domain-containing protein [Phenylobacterium sp.]THD62343.1 MAG: PEP-CTERM sorting domain-containing protein [Phenylobacterium sp.]